MSEQQKFEQTVEKLMRAERRFLESVVDDIWDRYVDPRDEFEGWTPLDSTTASAWLRPNVLPYRNETDLTTLRAESRQIVNQNEFAINAIENRISYVVGTGHVYSVAARGKAEMPEKLDEQVKEVVDDFAKRNHWSERQQEVVRRRDRDGEVFLRFFSGPGGLQVRFVEPEQVHEPRNAAMREDESYGIRTVPGDAETPVAYCIDEQWIDASEIQHRKANVDLSDPRGVPTFYPVRKNLARAAKMLRNMSTTAEIQSAIAMVRRHAAGTAATIQAAVEASKDAQRTANTSTGTKTRTYKEYPPGSILDTNLNTEYQFPTQGIDISKYVTGIQAELRAVASRLVMPEFMLTSDASNANYSSTLVSEGPAVKMFERLQAEMIEADTEVLERAVQAAIDAGQLPANTLELVEIQAEPPNVTSRDRLKEVQADAMLVDKRVMSRETMAGRHDLDWETELQRMEDQLDRDAAAFGLPGLGFGQGAAGNSGGNNENGDDDDDDDNNNPRGGREPQRAESSAGSD